ncbi:uncharacterized protein LOC128193112 isoform X4 [Crassostrea angulata]|uniref:uncharacterized protein LOC128193112 isoform X4 n=1 Tax=Magallana angulata TaxID=2784310 RepID=UPI0022B19966|nr:uncharacterized protein LOC128193112 isoform X4 [Crassostrea angulata]
MEILTFLVLFCFSKARAQLEAFYHPLSWSTAKSKCGDRGGYLAQLQTSSKVIDLTRLDAVFRPEAIYWVGGHLQDNGWNLYDNRCHNNQSNPGTPVDGRPSKELIVYKGCFRSTLIKGGIPLKNINARDCFEQCGWTGTVGLYSTMCLCDHHLHQLTRLPEADCDIRCTRCDTDTCGGIKGVSVYSYKKSVIEIVGNQTDGEMCAYIHIDQSGERTMRPADCLTHLKYLCRFDSNSYCGGSTHCFRPSFTPDTWSKAWKTCHSLNGSLASINIDDDLPTGKFWVAIKKDVQWRWLDGSLISPSQLTTWTVSGSSVTKSTGSCLALRVSSKDEAILTTVPCNRTLGFLCQYGSLKKEEFLSTSIDLNVVVNNTDPYNTTSAGQEPKREKLLLTILYLGIGVVSGVAFVFAIGVFIYMARRCCVSNSDFKPLKSYNQKPEIIHCKELGEWRNDVDVRHGARREVRPESEILGEWPKEGETLGDWHRTEEKMVEVRSGGDLVYDVPSENRNEALFRQNQRIIKQGSWRCGNELHVQVPRKTSTGSWREGRLKERPVMGCEILNTYPSQERDFRDISYAIHRGQNDYQRRQRENGNVIIDTDYEERDLDMRLRQPMPPPPANEVFLADTYSFPVRNRQSAGEIHMDPNELYATVHRAVYRDEDNADQMVSMV